MLHIGPKRRKVQEALFSKVVVGSGKGETLDTNTTSSAELFRQIVDMLALRGCSTEYGILYM